MKRLCAVTLGACLLACGGSSSTPCTKVTGTWHLTDTRTSTSSSFCSSATSSDTSTVALSQTTASTFTWTETDSAGRTFVINGQGSVDSCAANVTLTLSATSQQTGYTETVSANRSVTLDNNTLSGVAQVTITTSPQQTGTPCTANFTTSGTR